MGRRDAVARFPESFANGRGGRWRCRVRMKHAFDPRLIEQRGRRASESGQQEEWEEEERCVVLAEV